MAEILRFTTDTIEKAKQAHYQSGLDYQNLSDDDIAILAAEELDYSQMDKLTPEQIIRLSERLYAENVTSLHHRPDLTAFDKSSEVN